MSDTSERAKGGVFRALRHRNYKLWFFGQIVSLVGTWMQMIAQQWLVYRLTGSPAMLGVMSLVPLIPLLPLSIWAGSVADRWSKRDILVATQTTMMVQAFVLAALVWSGHVQVWHVILLALGLGVAQAIDAPARQSFVVELVDDRADLTNAIGLNSTVFNAGRAIGPAVAGVAVATTGEAGAFLINGVSFIAIIAGLLMMRLPRPGRSADSADVGAHVIEGVRYVRSNTTVLVLMSIVAVSAFLSMPYSTLLPVFAKDQLHDSATPILAALCSEGSGLSGCQSPDALTYGLLMAASGIGAVIGALAMAALPESAPRGRMLVAGTIIFPAVLLPFAASRSFLLTCLLLFVAGMSFVSQQVLVNALIQMNVEDRVRGRVMSVYSLAFQGMMRLGGLQAGLAGQALTAPVSVALGAGLSLLYAVSIALRFPKLRQLR